MGVRETNNWLRTRQRMVLVVILIVALGLRLAYALGCQVVPDISDAGTYNRFALNWIRGSGLIAEADGTPSAYRPPLYPMFLGTIYLISGELNYRAVFIAQSILSLAVIVSVFLTADHFFGRWAGLVAAAISAVYPAFVLYNITTMTESVSLAFTTAAVAILVKVRAPLARGALAGCCIGLGSLCKPAVLFFAPGIVCALLLAKRPLKERALSSLVFAAMTAALLVPWTARNWLVFREFIPLADNGPVNFYLANNAAATGEYVDPTTTPLVRSDLAAAVYYREGASFILGNPRRYMQLGGTKAATVMSPDRDAWMLDPLVIPSASASEAMHINYERYKANLDGEGTLVQEEVLAAGWAKAALHLLPMAVMLVGWCGIALFARAEQAACILPGFGYLALHVLLFIFNLRMRLLWEPTMVVYSGAVVGSVLLAWKPGAPQAVSRRRLALAVIAASIVVAVWASFLRKWAWL